MELAGSDRGLVVRLDALRLEALRFVVFFGLDLGALFSFLVVCVIGPRLWMRYPHVRGYWQFA